LDSENFSAPGETGGQSQVCESSVARPLGSEAATPAAAADAASGEGSLATGARDEGLAKALIAQPAEPSVEAEKNSPAGKTGSDHEVGDSLVAVASFDGAAVDLHSNLRLGPIWVKSGTEIETGASFSLNLSANFAALSGESGLLFDCGLPGFDDGV